MKRWLLLWMALLVSHGAMSQAREPLNLDQVQLPPIERPASTARKGAASAYTVEPTYFYTYLLSTSTGNAALVNYQAIGYLTRMDARIELTGLLGCSEAGTFVPFAGYYADRYNCPLYNGVVAVAWTPDAFYTPWIWYYFLTP